MGVYQFKDLEFAISLKTWGSSASLKTWESCDGPTAGLLLRVGVLDLALLVGQAVLQCS